MSPDETRLKGRYGLVCVSAPLAEKFRFLFFTLISRTASFLRAAFFLSYESLARGDLFYLFVFTFRGGGGAGGLGCGG